MDLKNVIAAARARITPNPVFTAGTKIARRAQEGRLTLR